MSERRVQFHFPKKFMWGASISTHQVEGGNYNQWSVWELETAKRRALDAEDQYGHLSIWPNVKSDASLPHNYVSGDACDHFNLYEQDFKLAQQIGLDVVRCGIEWSRIEPEEGEFNEEAITHYIKYFNSLKTKGIKPVITLWHWSVPVWFAQKGGFLKQRNIKYFTRYVKHISEKLGVHFNYVITLNEPTVYAVMSYHERRWPPEGVSKIQTLRVMLNLAKAHNKSYKIIKKARPSTKIGLAHNCAYFYTGDDSIISKAVVWICHRFSNEFFVNRVKRRQDFFGLNYYFANKICGTRVHNDNKAINDLGWDMQPDKVGLLAEQLYKKYKLPIMITENGVADMKDQYRKWWITESVKALNLALKNNTSIIGYIHWSLLDNFEWAEGFWPRFGLIEVDYKTKKRKVRESAKFYSKLIKTIKHS